MENTYMSKTNRSAKTQHSSHLLLSTNYSRSGQMLLILVMIMAIALTVVLTMTFTTRTDTQLTKLEEENQKALAAAEAGIEQSLKSGGPVDLMTSGSFSSSLSSGSTTLTSSASDTFTSPTLTSGEAYTAYLGTYSAGSPPTYGASTATNIIVCYGTGSALDIALVKNTAPQVKHYVADAEELIYGSGDLSETSCPDTSFAHAVTVPGTDVGVDARFLVVRAIGASTKLSINKTGLPSQGRTVSSQVTTKTQVTKKVQLFQSYPQIPAEFFFTSF